jgi:hypothetical protein
MFTNYDGEFNSALGTESLYNNYSGYSNTAVGYQAAKANAGGHWNTAVGNQALFSCQDAYNNTAVGTLALNNTSSGNNNTALGGWAGTVNTTGHANTCIGAYAEVGAGSFSNATAIGYQATANAGDTVVEGQVAYTYPSDGRFKRNIQHNVPGLAFITKLDPVFYQFDNSSFSVFIGEKRAEGEVVKENISDVQMGFVAQDVERVCKEMDVPMFNFVTLPSSDKGTYSMAYSTLVVPLVKAVQEQQAMIEDLRLKNEELKSQNEEIMKRIAALEAN